MGSYENEIKFQNDEFEGRFNVDTGTLTIHKVLSTSLNIPENIQVDGNEYEVRHLVFPNIPLSFKNISFVSFPSTLLTIRPSGVSISPLFREFTGKIEVPTELKCFLDVELPKDKQDQEKIFNKYDNAYYFGNKENPYAFLYAAVSDDIETCTIHKDTKYICSGAFAKCHNLSKVILPDGLLGIGSFPFNYSKNQFNEYNKGYYIGSETNPYFAFLECDEDLDEYYVHKDTKCLLEIPEEGATIYLSSGVTLFPFYRRFDSEGYFNNIRFLAQPEGYILYGDDCLCEKEKHELLHVLGRMDPRIYDDVKVINLKAFDFALKEELIVPKHIEAIIDGWYGTDEFESVHISKDNMLRYYSRSYAHHIPNYYFDGSINEYIGNPLNSCFVSVRQKQYFKNEQGKFIKLKKVTIDSAPDYCLKYLASIEEVVIKEGVEEIGRDAFYACSNLKRIEIPSSVKKIGNSAFSNCISLKEIKIPSGVIELGDYIFEKTSSLEKIYLPNTIQKIGNGLLGILPPADLKGVIYYDGTYEQFLKIDIREGRDVIEKYLECKEMGGLLYNIKKELREFKFPNYPFQSNKCWWVVYRDVGNQSDSKLKVLDFNAYPPYVDDGTAKIRNNKTPVSDDFLDSLNITIGVDLEVFKLQYDSINQFIDNVLSGIKNCQDELNEMNPNDCVDVDEIPIYNYFDSLKDNPALFIKELNSFRRIHSRRPMLIAKIDQYDIAFYANELIAISDEDYHKYHSDEEVLELLTEKNSIKIE